MGQFHTLAQRPTLSRTDNFAFLLEGTLNVNDSFQFDTDSSVNHDEDDCKFNDLFSLHPNDSKYLDLHLCNIQYPFVIEKCYQFRYNKDCKKYYRMIQFYLKKKINDLKSSNGSDPFYSKYNLDKEIYSKCEINNSHGDSINIDSLYDSDIENLIQDDEKEEEEEEEGTRKENKQNMKEELDKDPSFSQFGTDTFLRSTNKPPQAIDNTINETYLLVSKKFIYLVESHIIYPIFEFTDLSVFRPNMYPVELSGFFKIWDDRILAITKEGIFVSLILRNFDSTNFHNILTSNFLNNDSTNIWDYPMKIIQYWNLKLGKYWKIVTSPYHNLICTIQYKPNEMVAQFITNLSIKIFCWIDQIEIKLIDSLLLPYGDSITAYTFMPSKQPILILCVNGSKGFKLVLIQWNQDNVSVIKKTIMIDLPVTEDISNMIPISTTHILICSLAMNFYAISLNDIYDNKICINQFYLKKIRPIISWFHTFDILPFFHNMDPKFKKYDHCVIFADGNDTICCILSVSNSDNLNDIEIFYLAAVKGVTSIAPSYHQNNNFLNEFKMVVICFNKCIEITINLKEIVSIDKTITNQSENSTHYTLPSRKSIISTKTLSSMIQSQQTGIISISSKEETWITSDSIISQVQPIPFLFTRRTRLINPVIHNFNRFNSITYIKGNDLLGHNLLLATDNKTLTRCYVIETEHIEDLWSEEQSHYQFLEVDDLLPRNNKGTLFFHIYDNFVVQLTNDQLLIRSLISPFETKIIFTVPSTCNIDNCTYQDNKLVIWDSENFRVWCIDDLSQISISECKEIQTFNKLITNHFNFSFHIAILKSNPDDYTIVLRNTIGIFSTPWRDFISNNSDNITLVKSISIHDFVMCDESLCIFLYYNNVQKPMLRISDLTTRLVSSWNYISLYFRPGEKFQLKLLNETTVALFSTRHFYLIYVNDLRDIVCEEVQLPFFNRMVVLLDVFYNQSNNTLFCLYDDGLRIIKLTYLSQSRMDHILLKTKDTNKIFLYLEKLNRLLVVHPQKKYWYLMKLENGTIRSLDPRSLQLERYPLQQIIEINNSSLNTSLILRFQNCIKYVIIMAKNNKIIVKILDTMKTNLSFPRNKLIPTINQDVIAMIGTDKEPEPTDKDVTTYLPDSSQYEDIKCSFFEYIIRNNRIELKENIPLDWLKLSSMQEYFIYVDSILINSSSGIYIYVNFKLPFFKELISTPKKESYIQAIKVNENMLLVKYSQGEGNVSKYSFVYNDKIFDAIRNPEKYWEIHNNKLTTFRSLDEDNELYKHLSTVNSIKNDVWTEKNCLTERYRYYNGHKIFSFGNDSEVVNQEKIKDYIIGLPIIFPKLTSKQRKVYPITLEIPEVIHSNFDSKNRTLSILSKDGSFRQYKNEPISLTLKVEDKITTADMMNQYIHRSDTIRLSKLPITTKNQQGFVCEHL